MVLRHPDSPLVNLLGVRYLITEGGLPDPLISRSGLRKQFPEVVWTDGNAAIWENPDRLPRAFVVPEVVLARDLEAAVSLVGSAEFDPRRIAVVEQEILAPESLQGASSGTVAYKMLGPNRRDIRVVASAPTFLVIAEAYTRGWIAEIDGERASLFPTNVAMMGLSLPAGTHNVRLRYTPASFRIGVAITAAALCLLMVVLLLDRRSQRRNASSYAA